MTPDCFDSTALPEGAPHLIDRLDAAIAEGEEALAVWDPRTDDDLIDAFNELVAVAREARDVLDAEGFGR